MRLVMAHIPYQTFWFSKFFGIFLEACFRVPLRIHSKISTGIHPETRPEISWKFCVHAFSYFFRIYSLLKISGDFFRIPSYRASLMEFLESPVGTLTGHSLVFSSRISLVISTAISAGILLEILAKNVFHIFPQNCFGNSSLDFFRYFYGNSFNDSSRNYSKGSFRKSYMVFFGENNYFSSGTTSEVSTEIIYGLPSIPVRFHPVISQVFFSRKLSRNSSWNFPRILSSICRVIPLGIFQGSHWDYSLRSIKTFCDSSWYYCLASCSKDHSKNYKK